MTRVLLTGYEPFGEFDRNPSGRLADELDGTDVAGAPIVGRTLPVAFDRAFPLLRDLVDEHDPDVVLATGLAAGRPALSLERIGINLRDTVGIPDNDDREVVDEPIVPDAPDAHFADLPLRSMREAIREAGVPAALSNSAGTHLCNDVLYAVRHHAEATDRAYRSGFVHLPQSHEMAADRDDTGPSMSFEAMSRGIRAGLEAAIESPTDPA